MIKSTIAVKTVRTFDINDLGDLLWGGASERWDDATDEQREAVFERILDYFYDEVEDTSINDFVWFDCDDIFFAEDEDNEEGEDEDNEEERFAIVYGEGELKYGRGEYSGSFFVGVSKYDDVVKAAIDTTLCNDYEELESYETLEEAQEALKSHVSRIYELTSYIGNPYVYARMFLLIHYHEGGYDIAGVSPVQNELVKDEDNEE